VKCRVIDDPSRLEIGLAFFRDLGDGTALVWEQASDGSRVRKISKTEPIPLFATLDHEQWDALLDAIAEREPTATDASAIRDARETRDRLLTMVEKSHDPYSRLRARRS
jgi:hypothetical protein